MIEIWHNPRCSKSRQTLALLEERGHEVKVRRYLDDPPRADEIRNTLNLLGISAIGLVRTGEQEFRVLGLSKGSDDATLVEAMASTPKLIERPVVFANGKAAIGRPPEAVLYIL